MAFSLPAKVLTASITAQRGVEKWPHDDGLGDKWWAGGSDSRFYRWELDITITPQSHSCHTTREPFLYNGYDVKVGDWIVNAASGLCVKVIGSTAKTPTDVTLTVEDVDRYNTFRDKAQSGNGAIGTGNSFIFTVNEEGEPLLDTIAEGTVSSVFFSNIMGRFQNLNKEYDFPLTQTAHTFAVGDIVAADVVANEFTLASSDHAFLVGRVSALGPGPNRFFVTPLQRIIDDLNSLPGGICSLLFVDDVQSGAVTETNTGHAVYIKLRENTKTTLTSDVSPITCPPGSEIKINGVSIPFPIGDKNDIISALTAASPATGVDIDEVGAPTQTVFVGSDLAYGIAGAIGATASITINGLPVTFDIIVEGSVAFGTPAANADDMVSAIERDVTAVNPDITAFVSGGTLVIVNESGGPITIANVTPDGAGANFAGPASCTGIPLSTAAGTDTFLRITGQDAGIIDIADVWGVPTMDLGLFTVENGTKSAALYVEQGIRSSSGSAVVVPDIAARDVLTSGAGEQAMVLDTGNGEWGLYLFDGSLWIQISDSDSAASDAQTMSVPLSYADNGTIPIGTVSDTSRVTLITIDVTTEFDGTPFLTIGDTMDPDRLFLDDWHDLTTKGVYTTTSNHFYDIGSDVNLTATYSNPGGPLQGEATITVSYM